MNAYEQMTNPEIVAAITRLDGAERQRAIDSLSGDRRAAVEAALGAQIKPDGARQIVLDRLGREKQITDSQAWTADGISPNSPLVTEATAGKHIEHGDPEGVIDTLAGQVAGKADTLAAITGRDTSATLSSDEAAEGKAEAQANATAVIPPDDSATAEGVGKKGRLPDEFPGRKALADADINTYAQLRKRLASGEHIPGIGDATQAQIEAAIQE